MIRLIACLMLLAGAAAAQPGAPITASEFERLTTGKTLYYTSNGYDYGIEEYLEGRRVRWSFLGGDCQDGEWYPAGDMICFVYEAIGEPQCWTFYDRPGGLVARFENDPESTELVATRQTRDPLMCLGPTPGV